MWSHEPKMESYIEHVVESLLNTWGPSRLGNYFWDKGLKDFFHKSPRLS